MDYKKFVRRLRNPDGGVDREECAEVIEELASVNDVLVKEIDACVERAQEYSIQLSEAEEKIGNLSMRLEQLSGPEKFYKENDYLHSRCAAQDQELQVLRAQMEIVYLIFGSHR